MLKLESCDGNFLDAENMIKQQQTDGILLLPENLSNSLRHGEVGGIGALSQCGKLLKLNKLD